MEPRPQADPDRLAAVERRLRGLQQQLEQLTQRVQAVETGRQDVVSAPLPSAPPDAGDGTHGSWLLHSALLRRVATISFVLVLALVLRTLTDSGVVTSTVGVWLGIGYAMSLLLVGWRRLASGRPGKRVFTICGALLLCSLVLETHSRFDYLGTATAHGLLAGTLVVCAWLGVRYGSAVVAEAGVLAAAVTALALGFPCRPSLRRRRRCCSPCSPRSPCGPGGARPGCTGPYRW